MQKKLLNISLICIVFLWFGTLNVSAQETVYESDVIVKKGIVYYEGQAFSGWLLSDENGIPNKCDCTLKAPYKNGKLHGTKKEWYKSGVLKYSGTYSKGYKYGTHIAYYPNGNTKLKTVYKKGVVHKIFYRKDGSRKKYEKWKRGELIFSKKCTTDMGDCIEMFSDEEVVATEVSEEEPAPDPSIIIMATDSTRIDPPKLFEGRQQILFPDQNPARIIHYKDGLIVSDSTFYKNATIKSIKLLEAGELKHQELFNENGNKLEENNFLNNQKNGVQKQYYESGIIKQEEFYENGERTKKIDYYESGSAFSEENYVHNKKHGKQKKYDKNGKLQFVEHYENGKLISSSSFNSGVLQSDFIYDANGKIKEKWHYDETGKLTKKELYDEKNELKEEIEYDTQTGFPKKSISYTNGIKIIINYDDNGKKSIEQAYNGSKLIRKGSYKNDKKEGKWFYYAEDGKSETIKIFSKDQSVKEYTIYYHRLIKNRINEPYTRIIKYQTKELEDDVKYYLLKITFSDKNKQNKSIEDKIAQTIYNQFQDYYSLVDDVKQIENQMISGELNFYETRYRLSTKNNKPDSNRFKFALGLKIKLFDFDGIKQVQQEVKEFTYPKNISKNGYTKMPKALSRVLDLVDLQAYISHYCFPKKGNLLKVFKKTENKIIIVTASLGKEYIDDDKYFYIIDENNHRFFAKLKVSEATNGQSILKVVEGGNWLFNYLKENKHPVITQKITL